MTEQKSRVVKYSADICSTYFRDANGRLIRERHVSNLDQSEVNLVYQYDSSGAIIGFTYYPNSPSLSQYFFGKNAQGDVICIYDESGTTVARYSSMCGMLSNFLVSHISVESAYDSYESASGTTYEFPCTFLQINLTFGDF